MTTLVCDETGMVIPSGEFFYVVTRSDGIGILALSKEKVATLPNGALLTMGPPGPGFEGLCLHQGFRSGDNIFCGDRLFTMSQTTASVNLPTIAARLAA